MSEIRPGGLSLSARVREIVTRFRVPLLMLGAVLTGLCVILPQIGVLAWITAVPSCAVILTVCADPSVRLRRLYGYGFLFFESYFLVTFHWFLYMYPLTFAGLSDAASAVVVGVAWFGLSAFQAVGAAILFPLMALAVRGRVLSRVPLLHPFLFAALWTALEWWQANSGWSGVPWGRLPISQTGVLITAQSAAYFGTYFVTFLIVSVNGLLAYLLLHPDRRRLCLIAAGSLLAGDLALGGLRMLTQRDEGQPVVAAALQGNMSSLDKWGFDSMSKAQDVYEQLALDAAAEGASLIVLPETAFPSRVDRSEGLREYLLDLSGGTRATILAGVFTTGYRDGLAADYNSVVAAGPDGAFCPVVYNKRKPVPFGEFVPWRDVVMTLVPPLAEIGMLDDDLLVGDDAAVMPLPDGRVGALVCFDSIYETLALDSVRHGAQLLTVSTNDSWFQDSRGVWMHNAQSQLRAIETGRWVVRAANTGVSSIISPTGRVTEELGPLRTGMVTGEVYMNSERTLYSYIGNTFAYLCLAFCAACVLSAPAAVLYEAVKKRAAARSER